MYLFSFFRFSISGLLGQQNSQDDKFFFYFLIYARSDYLTRIRWLFFFYLKVPDNLCIWICLSIYRSSAWTIFNDLHNSHWIAFPTMLNQDFCASVLHSLIMSHICHHITYTYYFVAYYQFPPWYNWPLWYYFVLLFRDSVSLLRFLLLSYV